MAPAGVRPRSPPPASRQSPPPPAGWRSARWNPAGDRGGRRRARPSDPGAWRAWARSPESSPRRRPDAPRPRPRRGRSRGPWRCARRRARRAGCSEAGCRRRTGPGPSPSGARRDGSAAGRCWSLGGHARCRLGRRSQTWAIPQAMPKGEAGSAGRRAGVPAAASARARDATRRATSILKALASPVGSAPARARRAASA